MPYTDFFDIQIDTITNTGKINDKRVGSVRRFLEGCTVEYSPEIIKLPYVPGLHLFLYNASSDAQTILQKIKNHPYVHSVTHYTLQHHSI